MPLCGILKSEFWFTAKCHFQSCESVCTNPLFPSSPSYSLRVYVSPSYSLECHADVCNELLEFLSYATRNCLLHEFSSQPSHSDCCPCVILLHVLLVLVVPRSTNLRLSDVIGSKLHIFNFDIGFPRIAPNVEAFTTQNISECYFWSFRGIICLANNSRLHFH